MAHEPTVLKSNRSVFEQCNILEGKTRHCLETTSARHPCRAVDVGTKCNVSKQTLPVDGNV